MLSVLGLYSLQLDHLDLVDYISWSLINGVILPTKTSHDTSFVNVNSVLKLNPAVLILPNIEEPVYRFKSE